MLKVQTRKRRGAFELDVDIELAQSGVIALFGPSGCGKTTLVDLIAGLVRPDAGRIIFDGHTLFSDSDGIDVAPEYRGIGYVFQNARLFPHLDVRANMNYGARRCARTRYIGFDEVVALLDL
jgi:molybdate transport system ATP-binding protein